MICIFSLSHESIENSCLYHCVLQDYNLKYVDMIEEQLNEALTTYRKPVDGDNYVRRSNQRLQRPNVYLPVHLYGQLVHDKTGCHLLEVQVTAST